MFFFLFLSPCLTFRSSGAPLVGLPRVHIGLVPCRTIVVVSFSSPPKGSQAIFQNAWRRRYLLGGRVKQSGSEGCPRCLLQAIRTLSPPVYVERSAYFNLRTHMALLFPSQLQKLPSRLLRSFPTSVAPPLTSPNFQTAGRGSKHTCSWLCSQQPTVLQSSLPAPPPTRNKIEFYRSHVFHPSPPHPNKKKKNPVL